MKGGSEMDKHTKRYLFERFDHSGEQVGMGDIMNFLDQSSGHDDMTYLSSAIREGEFTDTQRQYLQFKLWDQLYGRN
jgi:hypothetical protein